MFPSCWVDEVELVEPLLLFEGFVVVFVEPLLLFEGFVVVFVEPLLLFEGFVVVVVVDVVEGRSPVHTLHDPLLVEVVVPSINL